MPLSPCRRARARRAPGTGGRPEPATVSFAPSREQSYRCAGSGATGLLRPEAQAPAAGAIVRSLQCVDGPNELQSGRRMQMRFWHYRTEAAAFCNDFSSCVRQGEKSFGKAGAPGAPDGAIHGMIGVFSFQEENMAGERKGAGMAARRTDMAGALLCLCLAAREEPDVDLWSTLAQGREDCPALFRKSLSYLKSALEGSCSPKGIAARLDEIDSMIALTEGGESIGDGAALAAMEMLRAGYAALSDEEDDPAGVARALDLALVSEALDAEGIADPRRRDALEGEDEFCSELLRLSQEINAGGAKGRAAVRKALERAIADGASAIGIEAVQPALA
jgi:hypothetical protein